MKRTLILALVGLASCLVVGGQEAISRQNPVTSAVRAAREKQLSAIEMVAIAQNEKIPPIGTFFSLDKVMMAPLPCAPKNGIVVAKDKLGNYYYVEDPEAPVMQSSRSSANGLDPGGPYGTNGAEDGDPAMPTGGIYIKGLLCPDGKEPAIWYMFHWTSLTNGTFYRPQGWSSWTNAIPMVPGDAVALYPTVSCFAHTNAPFTNLLVVGWELTPAGPQTNTIAAIMPQGWGTNGVIYTIGSNHNSSLIAVMSFTEDLIGTNFMVGPFPGVMTNIPPVIIAPPIFFPIFPFPPLADNDRWRITWVDANGVHEIHGKGPLPPILPPGAIVDSEYVGPIRGVPGSDVKIQGSQSLDSSSWSTLKSLVIGPDGEADIGEIIISPSQTIPPSHFLRLDSSF